MKPRAIGPGIEDGKLLQVSWRDGERVFCRASHKEPGEEPRMVLVVVPAAEHPTSGCLDRLAHEFSLKDDLAGPWAVQPVDLVREHGRTRLVLDDPGAEPLSGLLGAPMETLTFLRLAEATAGALRGLHTRGLVHKDINPANVLVDEAAGQAWLTGFGIASRLPSERQTPSPSESLVGTLAYMAPEQTGRMNRSIDSRSDLYALGVTFYQMLTGALPFAASDPMEWVHCHIARTPRSPSERVGAIPAPVSQLVLKLLAKNAEDRYQTAAGVEHDLRRCRAEWEARGRINTFALGEHDASDRLLIPEKLYGRSGEVAALHDAFEQVVATGAPELVLVSGYSGIGKSSVVNELHKVLVSSRGLFAFGKFDQYKRDIPYATLAQAFRGLVRQILSRSEADLQAWRRAIGEALGSNGRLIVDLIPELALIIGQQPPVADLPPRDAQRRFQAALRRFIGVFARADHPLALFLDDLQWLDTATLDLIEDLLTQIDLRYLLLIGAYRDNEVDASHPLMRKLGAIRGAGARVQDIVLAPLSDGDLEQLVADALRCEPTAARPLVELLREKTDGNPFFATQFLHTLAEERLLVLDHAEVRWTWDLGHIHAKRYTDNVVDLMIGKLGRLPVESQEALRHLACVGADAEFELLGRVCQTSLETLHGSLREAVRVGLVIRLEASYDFQHDRIQEAAYSLIPEEERAEAHLRIGRLLLGQTEPDKRDELVFEIVSHFNRSGSLMATHNEREQVARLNLIAGKRARNAAAYPSALTYFAKGRALLADDCWTRQPRLAFEFELHRAECELLTGELASAEQRLSMLANRAGGPVDQGAVTCLRVDLYVILARTECALDVGLNYLRQVGLNVSANPTDEEVRQEYERIWQRLGTRRVEDLVDLPLMKDPDRRATIDVLNKLGLSALYDNTKVHQLLIAHMVNFSMKHGNTPASCVAYITLGRLLATEFGDYVQGLSFSQLSLDLVEKQGLDAFAARVYFNFGTGVSSWVQHLRFGRSFLNRALDEANKRGDLPYIGYCRTNIVGNLISSGEPLFDVDRVATESLDLALQTGSRIAAAYIVGMLQLVRSLRGLPCDFKSLDDEPFDAVNFERRLGAGSLPQIVADLYWSRRMRVFLFEGDYASALEAARRPNELRWPRAPNIEHAEHHFYAALAQAGSVGAIESTRTREGMAHLEALTAHYRQLQTWAEQCPDNFAGRAALVGAELARLDDRELEAERLYAQAIRSARANGFIHIEALACEKAARFHTARGFEDIAEMYLVKARDGYRRWGADSLVRRLEASYPWLVAADRRDRDSETPPDQQLDVAAVVKASQALSSEILLPRLIERLMTIALQNAGGDRGLLILPHEGDYRIGAAARADGEAIALQYGVPDDPAAPESLIRYAIRTQETVILDDATKPHLFSKDPDLALRRPRSILCLPLVRQGALSGLLYLENSLASDVFTPERARLLELLASQAAISLENAALYGNLELQVSLLQQLPVSAWTLKPDGTPDFVNQVWLNFSGQTPEFIRSHPEAWMTAVHPEDREITAKTFWEGVRSGKGFAFETRSLRAEDGTYRRHLQQVVALCDPEGKVLKFVGTTTDIDDQKRAEETLRQAQADLAHVTRVGTLNAMTASIAHEVNQPLSGILTNANTGLRMLAAEPPNVAGAAETARRTIRDANRASEIIKRLRDMFSKKEPVTELVDLNNAARDVIAIAAGELQRRGARLQTDLADGLPPVSADRVQLQQVILNLLLNAADAMDGIEDRPRSVLMRTELESDDAVRLEVRDAGIGFDPASVEKLFEAFHTTKPNGMGVGLSICRSIIESHNGRIWAALNDGAGATFSLSIPAAARDYS